MSIAPTLCADCQSLGIIATVNGPTCVHGQYTGLLWWPAEWPKMTTDERVAWLTSNRKTS